MNVTEAHVISQSGGSAVLNVTLSDGTAHLVPATVVRRPIDIAVEALRPPDIRPPWQWIEENYRVMVTSRGAGQLWQSENSPWVKQITEDFADNRVRIITCLCSAQSAKTETMLGLSAWIISEDPSPTMWVAASDEEGQKIAIERITPAFRACEPVARKMPSDRTLNKTTEIHFPDMTFEVVGANSKVKLQSRSRRYLLLDEVRNWKPWALPMVLKRVRTWWNSRTVILSTPDKKDDIVDREFRKGSQFHYHVKCPHCEGRAPLEFENLVWDTNETTCPDHQWDFVELAKTVRYRMPCCKREVHDTPPVRQALAESGVWVAHNPKAPPHLRSYTWNALLPTWVSWASIVEEFLHAKAHLDHGNFEPFKAFWNETLGRSWEDRLRYVQAEDTLANSKGDYDPGAVWPAEQAGGRRIMTVDVQGKGGRHYYWVVRAWAPGGVSRLLAFGRAWSMAEIHTAASIWHVSRENIAIDTGHFTAEVYTNIMESGVLPNGNYAWKALKGDRAPHYVIDGIRHYFTWTFVDPYLGKGPAGVRPIQQLLFSKSAMLERMELAMAGIGPSWEILADAPDLPEYCLQITAYRRREEPDADGAITYKWEQIRPDDHYGSCERMQFVCAMATGLLDMVPPAPPPPA
ncbi:MAG: phage terminase large subunit family protein [Opitutaceae bacterium]|jgi:hypothetical protein|nr:phage terminase large subunit family protein [Opitutaceae bacterium]